MRKLILLVLILLSSCAIRMVAVIETEDAVNGNIKIEKNQNENTSNTLPPAR